MMQAPERDIFVANDPRANIIGLPGRLDSEFYNSTRYLAWDLEDALGEPVANLGMYRLDGVKLVGYNGSEDRPIYDCDWTPAQYFRLIRDAIASRPDQSKPAKLYGFSYGGQIALLYAMLDAALGINAVGTVVANMPTNFYWLSDESYSTDRDFDWMMRQLREHGRVDLDTVHTETRREHLTDPDSREAELRIPRRVLTSHTRPLDGVLDGNPMPVNVTGLCDSNILGHITARTHIIAGEYDGVNGVEMPSRIYDRLSPRAAGEFVVLAAQHDYRRDDYQIALINEAVVDLMAA